jgi:hypothetical protein
VSVTRQGQAVGVSRENWEGAGKGKEEAWWSDGVDGRGSWVVAAGGRAGGLPWRRPNPGRRERTRDGAVAGSCAHILRRVHMSAR